MAARPLATQVAGHAGGVMQDATGSLIIKPALPRETAFYQLLSSTTHPTRLVPSPSSTSFFTPQAPDVEVPDAQTAALYAFKRFVPKFLGTLNLEGQMKGGKLESVEGGAPAESIVIENLSYPFTHPSIIDIKLGTHLATPDAPQSKIDRMEEVAKATTSRETGLRLTGFSVWDPVAEKVTVTGKEYGKSIPASSLPTGFSKFFPIPNFPPSTSFDSPSLTEQYTHNLLRVLRALHATLAQLHTILETLEIRFIGASLLVVYEGDPGKLGEAWGRVDAWEKAVGEGVKGKGKSKIPEVRGDGLGPEFIDESDSDSSDEEDAEEDEEEDSVDAEISPDEDALSKLSCPPWAIRMIDFAHTGLCEGEGVDEGVLKGVGTVMRLVEGRIGELEGRGEGVVGENGEGKGEEEVVVELVEKKVEPAQVETAEE